MRTLTAGITIFVVLTIGLTPYYVHGQCYSEVCFFKGLDYAMRGEFQEAENQFKRTLQYDRYFQAARDALKIMEDYHKGVVSAKVVRSLFKGVYYLNRKRFERALEELNRAVEASRRGYYFSYYQRAILYTFMDEPEKAVKDFTRAIRLRPDLAELYYNRAVLYHRLGHLDEAIKDYTEAINLKPDLFRAYYNRGLIYMQKRQFQKAIGDFSETLKYKPNHTRAILKRAKAYQLLNNTTSACSDYKQACRLGLCSAYEASVMRGMCK